MALPVVQAENDVFAMFPVIVMDAPAGNSALIALPWPLLREMREKEQSVMESDPAFVGVNERRGEERVSGVAPGGSMKMELRVSDPEETPNKEPVSLLDVESSKKIVFV